MELLVFIWGLSLGGNKQLYLKPVFLVFFFFFLPMGKKTNLNYDHLVRRVGDTRACAAVGTLN